MNEYNIAFGVNLKRLRKKAGYTRNQLAQLLSYSEKSIEKWETGSSIPPVATICKLAQLFSVTTDVLIFPQKGEPKYLLGIDGGGTKTEFLLTDPNMNEINRVILGPSNPVDIGMENAQKILEQGIFQVCKGIDLRNVSVFAGLAGGISSNNKALINKFLSRFGFAAMENGSDTENALELTLHGGDGISVIMGTGNVAFSQVGENRYRIAGWGYLIDKGGSGYNFGADALDSAYRSIDGRGGSALIRELVEKKLGKPVLEAVADIYAGGKAFIASFCPVVFEAYALGDAEAERIIDRNVAEVAKIIIAGQTYQPNQNGKVVLCGGLCHMSQVLIPFFQKHLPENYKVNFSTELMVNGAVSLAKKNIERLNSLC